ncbi:MAG: hypothetical protein KF802_11895 [Bdellovibrionaceae bacterium]|nr:hypothetical protein [Pseudobdellovibrionaceae bacterium]MBX3032816.1 hypothetical protein [Pseudobdellovibrionaceae bacterium]
MTRVFLVAALLAVTTSCMKKPDLSQDDGAPVAIEDFEETVVDTWGSASPMSIQRNEFAYTEKTLEISSLPLRVAMQDGKTVQSVTDTPEKRTYIIAQQVTEIDNNNEGKQSTSEYPLEIGKSLALSNDGLIHAAEDRPGIPIGYFTMASLVGACRSSEDGKWKSQCYDLKTWVEDEEAPPQVAARPGCEGLTNCRWKKRAFSFTRVVEFVDPDSQTTVRSKIIYTAKVSPDAPYLSRLTDFCIRGLTAVGNQKIPVTICESIRNFRRGGSE